MTKSPSLVLGVLFISFYVAKSKLEAALRFAFNFSLVKSTGEVDF
jgi:hypothetical protein